jgi:hypothetical protein
MATAISGLGFHGVANAEGFTNESFQGTYAARSIGGANDSIYLIIQFIYYLCRFNLNLYFQ